MSKLANDNAAPEGKPSGGMDSPGSGGVKGGEANKPGQSPHDAKSPDEKSGS